MPDAVAELKAVLHKVNADARIIETNHSKVPLKDVLNTHLFDFEEASQGAGWIKELNEEHIPETLECFLHQFLHFLFYLVKGILCPLPKRRQSPDKPAVPQYHHNCFDVSRERRSLRV